MNNAYIFLLKKRYHYKWKNLKEKVKYYFDFSIIYIALALGFIFNFYRDLMKNPPLMLQSIASFLTLIPLNFIVTLVLLLLIQYSIRGLKTPPMYFNKGDTYFLFTLPIPKNQYIFFEYILAQGEKILIVLGVLVLAIPVYPLIWDSWFVYSVKLFFVISILLILLGNVQWLVFQLPIKIKRIILKILRYIKITFLVIFIISILYIVWMLIFNNNALLDNRPPIMSVHTTLAFNLKVGFSLLLGLGFLTTVLSIYFFKKTSLESLKESSLSHAKIKTLMSLGMGQQAKKIMKTEGKKEKRYFLSIPGYYENSKIFLWRNASQLIKQPFEFIYSYILYLGLSIGVIISTKAEAISLVFIFIALYILGQNMLSPIKKHYEENFFLSSFPVQSKFILRGYILLPLVLVTIIGITFSLLMGWMYKDFWLASLLILNIPFFSYYTLLVAMRNAIEEINFALNTNKTLVIESTLLIQGATPIVFGILFLKGGVPLWVIGLGAAIGYFMMIKTAEKEAVRPLQNVFNKYS